MHRRYGDQVVFLAVYIREAHPIDGWRSEANDRIGLTITQPLDIGERRGVAQRCCTALEIKMPVIVDELNDRVSKAYNAMPDRLFLVDKQGRIAYRGGQGPFGYNPAELEHSLLLTLLEEGALPSASQAAEGSSAVKPSRPDH